MVAFYLDTSGLLKRLLNEKGSQMILDLFLLKRPSEDLVSSYFGFGEAASVLARLLRGKHLTDVAYRTALSTLTNDMRTAVQVESLPDSLLQQATVLTLSHTLRYPDAIHLATALRLKAGVAPNTYLFVCSDVRLKVAASASGLQVLDPEAPDSLRMLRSLR